MGFIFDSTPKTHLNPDSVDVQDFLGAAYLKSGDHEKALEELGHVQRLKPEFHGELHKLLDYEAKHS